MKRTAVILLVTLYSLSTFGVNLKEFYCCGKLKSVSLALSAEKTNKCSKGENDEACCKTKYQYFKVKDNHFASSHIAAPLNYFSDLHTTSAFYQFATLATQKIGVINGCHAPPLHSSVPIYISHCVFRI